MERMGAQLTLWMVKTHNAMANIRRASNLAGLDAVMYINEMRALHSIEQAQRSEAKAQGDRP